MKILIFSGTSDGRELAEWLFDKGYNITVSAATKYGAELTENIKTIFGRLTEDEMKKVISEFDIVIDATHPYAKEATRNIFSACDSTKTKYIRLVRDETKYDGCIVVSDTKQAAEYLKNTEGDVFVSTGSKELSEFEPIGDRVTARVLDTKEVKEKCSTMNIKRIMYKMPPYSVEDNLNDFKDCTYLVTKDSGARGGTAEKLAAAEYLGIKVIMIKRPLEAAKGLSLEEIKDYMENK